MAAGACLGWLLLYHLRHVYMDMLNMQSFYLIRIILSRFAQLEIMFLIVGYFYDGRYHVLKSVGLFRCISKCPTSNELRRSYTERTSCMKSVL
jgi:hypothetical protein